jgi:hypothetical protein
MAGPGGSEEATSAGAAVPRRGAEVPRAEVSEDEIERLAELAREAQA